jgi:hypothetical protein
MSDQIPERLGKPEIALEPESGFLKSPNPCCKVTSRTPYDEIAAFPGRWVEVDPELVKGKKKRVAEIRDFDNQAMPGEPITQVSPGENRIEEPVN